MIWSSSSTRTGLLKPKRSMLRSICLICLGEWVRALPGYGRREWVGRFSTFIFGSPCCGRTLIDPSAVYLDHQEGRRYFMSTSRHEDEVSESGSSVVCAFGA